MQYTTIALLASFLASASAAPTSEPIYPDGKKPTVCKPVYPSGTTPVEPPVNTVITEYTQLQIFTTDKAPENLKQFDGYYLKRQTQGDFKDQVAISATGGEYFKQDWSTEEGGMYINSGRLPDGSSSTEVAQPVVFSSEKTGTFIVRDDNAQFTYRTFAGWQVCTSMHGPYLYFVSTGFKEQAGCTPCRVSVVKSAVL